MRRQTIPLAYRVALRVAAGWAPEGQRTEWLAEWGSEAWYAWEALAEEGLLKRQGEMARFCAGAIGDLRYLRGTDRDSRNSRSSRVSRRRVQASSSAVGCAAMLGVGVAVCFVLAQTLPRVRRAIESQAYRNVTGVVTISPASAPEDGAPPMHLETVRAWRGRSQQTFSEFGFYQPAVRRVQIAVDDVEMLRVARCSPNLLALLGVSGRSKLAERAGELPVLMLSEAAWKSRFGGDEAIFGRRAEVGRQRVLVGGVVPDGMAPAGGTVDAWMVLPEAMAAELPDETRVFAVGRTTAGLEEEEHLGQRWALTASGNGEHTSDFECIGLPPGPKPGWELFVFAMLLALLSLPATTSLPLGDYAPRPVSLSWTTGPRRWLFLAAKVALALPAIYFGSMVLAYAIPFPGPETAEYVQMVSSFAATLFGLRWALRDQRKRCPVCLGKLTCPARVGEPSRNFLSWNGTELICSAGHGWMHVPELPTSWFGTQRWLHLDPTWRSLFPRPI